MLASARGPVCLRLHTLPPCCPTTFVVHVAEEALSYTSIGILATFTAELAAKLLVFGFKYFTHSR